MQFDLLSVVNLDITYFIENYKDPENPFSQSSSYFIVHKHTNT